jgi:hypothetical protein
MLKYIAKISQNGEIISLALPKGANNISEGFHESENVYVVYIDFEIDNRPLFMETHYYQFELEMFVERQKKPNPVAYWSDGQWTWDTEKFLDLVRRDRDKKLYQSDWTQVADAPVDSVVWATYRQALRDFPSTIDPSTASLEDLVWPTAP